MKIICRYLAACSLLAATAFAQSPVTVTVDTQTHSHAVSPDFLGVSIFTGTQVHDHKGVPGNLFSGTNEQLITLFKNTGLHHLRLGATGSPDSGTPNLSHEDIDSLFAFARAADIRVIYSLHFADGPATAKYVWDNYRANLDCFAFDNEPDGRLDAQKGPDHKDYFGSWKDFAKSVADAVPGAKFAGPDAAGRTLVRRFVKAEKDSGNLALVTQHLYVGGNPIKKGIDTAHGIENMLSEDWVTNKYPELYKSVLEPVVKKGLPFRLTEFDDHVHGVTNGSDAFVAALWALDGAHWWAAHGAQGVNFQNTEWLRTDTFYRETNGSYQIHPRAYGIRAFAEGSRGSVEPLTIDKTNGLNLTAYAVGDATNLYVTLINKEHGATAREASVKIVPAGFAPASASVMFLVAPNHDVGAMTGMSLGGATITNDATWHGEWTTLTTLTNGQYTVQSPPASAAIVKMSTTQ